MNVNEIEDVLNVTTILTVNGAADQAHQPYLIAALIDWKNSTGIPDVYPDDGTVTAKAAKPKAKQGKATETPDSDGNFEPTPDPSDDPGF